MWRCVEEQCGVWRRDTGGGVCVKVETDKWRNVEEKVKQVKCGCMWERQSWWNMWRRKTEKQMDDWMAVWK